MRAAKQLIAPTSSTQPIHCFLRHSGRQHSSRYTTDEKPVINIVLVCLSHRLCYPSFSLEQQTKLSLVIPRHQLRSSAHFDARPIVAAPRRLSSCVRQISQLFHDDDDGCQVAVDAVTQCSQVRFLSLHRFSKLPRTGEISKDVPNVSEFPSEASQAPCLTFCRATEKADKLQPPPPTSPNPTSSPSDVPDPSPIAPSSNGTEVTDIDDSVMENQEQTPDKPHSRNSVLMQPELTVGR